MEHLFLSLLVLIMIVALASGFPVAFALPGSAIISIGAAAFFGYLFEGDVGAYYATDGPIEWLTAGITNFRSNYWDVETDTLIAIPLFIFMGIMLQKSKIAEDLLVTMGQLFGPIPGGLGISVIFVGALLAATTGIVGATVIAMGLISLPTMLNNNYDKSLASGIVCSSGTLGQIIPPSIVLIIIADQLASASDVANTMRQSDYKLFTGEFSMPGTFRVGSTSAGDMFLGALLPGLVLVGLYMLYVFVYARINPKAAPPVPFEGQFNFKFWTKVIMVIIPPLALIFAVLGSILMGIATVNQAGSIGAIGATMMAGYRLHQGKKDEYYPLILTIISIIPIFILSKNFNLNIKALETRDFTAILFAALTLVFIYRSVDLGIIAVFPTILASVWILATMTLLGITLNVLTVMVTALTIGLGIDYAIHIVERYREEREHKTESQAIETTIVRTGSALLISGLTTVSGFAVLFLSPMPLVRNFGIITAATIIYAMFIAIFVLPSLIWISNRIKEWMSSQTLD